MNLMYKVIFKMSDSDIDSHSGSDLSQRIKNMTEQPQDFTGQILFFRLIGLLLLATLALAIVLTVLAMTRGLLVVGASAPPAIACGQVGLVTLGTRIQCESA
jgi:hypothetical protein